MEKLLLCVGVYEYNLKVKKYTNVYPTHIKVLDFKLIHLS